MLSVASSKVERGSGRVRVTTRRASAAPRRLGSILARVARRRSQGTGPVDPSRPTPLYLEDAA